MHIFVEIRENTHKNKKTWLNLEKKKIRALENNSGLQDYTKIFRASPEISGHVVAL